MRILKLVLFMTVLFVFKNLLAQTTVETRNLSEDEFELTFSNKLLSKRNNRDLQIDYIYKNRLFDESLSNKIKFNKSVLYLYSNDSNDIKYTDIAKEDRFDLNFGFDVLTTHLQDSESKFKSVFSFYYAYDLKFKIANKLQLGLNYEPLKLMVIGMRSDNLVTKYTHLKEKYFYISTSINIYVRYIFTVQGKNNYRGLFLDLGTGYTFPYYFSYVYLTQDKVKISQSGIHNYKDFSVMARLGFYWGSVKGTYRFRDILTNNFVQPPKLTLAVEFNIPMH